MTKKLILVSVLMIALVAMLSAQAKINLKLSEIHAKGYPTELADEKFAELVGVYTNGEISIEVFPGGALAGDEKVAIEQVKVGAIAMARTSSGALGNFNPQMTVFGLPYLFDNSAHMWAFLQGAYGQKMLADLKGSGFIGLIWYDGGARSFYSVKKLTVPADLKGQKIRMIGNSILVKMADYLGASTNTMGAAQVFSSMQTGVIDGAENNPPSLISFNHYQVAKYYTLDEHCRLPEVLFINAQIWAKLNAKQQEAITRAAKETVEFQKKAWADYEIEALKQIKAAGVIVTEVADKTAWKAAVQPVFDAEKGPYLETIKAIEAARPKK